MRGGASRAPAVRLGCSSAPAVPCGGRRAAVVPCGGRRAQWQEFLRNRLGHQVRSSPMCGGAILGDLYSPVRHKVHGGDLWAENSKRKDVKNRKERSSWEVEEEEDDFEADF